MALFPDNWMRVFDIPDTSKHIKGFTIYKIVSIVYPKTCPDAVTKVTVWKRYNDFKKLHHELKARYKCMQITEKYPSLVTSSYFKRFDPEVINERRKSALAFLEFVAQYPPLFKAIEFVKFFESSHTPQEALNSNINIIRAQLNLPGDPEINLCNSEEEPQHSDSDTISTFSSVSGTTAKDEVGSPEQNSSSISEETKKLGASNSNISKVSSQDSSSSSSQSCIDLSTDCIQPTSPLPEVLQLECSNPVQYLTNAAQYITQATEFELEKKYEEAFNSYKLGISYLLTGVKDDHDSKRRQMVRHKTEIYLLRAEKIYNLHLSPEISQIRDTIQRTETDILTSYSTKRPVAELFDYKVLKVIDKGLVVLNKKEQNIFYMKVIEKSPQTPSTIYFNIPKDVPYMVKLFQYYDCFHSVFIVTQYISGEKLFDHIKQKSKSLNSNSLEYSSVTFEREVDQDSGNFDEVNSDSSECSYSDLIQNYTSKKPLPTDQSKSNEFFTNDNIILDKKNSQKSMSELSDQNNSISDDVFLKSSCSTGDLVSKSKQLLTSVSDTLLEQKYKEELVIIPIHSQETVNTNVVKRQNSEMSFVEEFSIVNYISPLSDIKKWASQILLALEKLHHCGIVVTDLNPRNLLLDDEANVKLTYIFNFQESNQIYSTNFEDSFYFAPEVISPQIITFAADWWSYGVILYELLTGIPLSSVHFEGMKKYTLLKIPKYVSPEGKSLLRQLLVYEPQDRLGCGVNGTEDLKSHPFFSGVDWDRLLTSAYN